MATQSTPAQARSINYIALTEVLLLGGTAVLFLSKWLRGLLSYYIHPRYTALVVVCAVVLLLMAAVRLRAVLAEPSADGPGWVHLLLALPLVFGTLVPAQPLGADTLSSRGVEISADAAPSSRWLPQSGDDTTRWNLLEWATALSMMAPELRDKPVDVTGFVFHDERLGSDSFYVVRYVITCCAADGIGAGLPVRWAGSESLPRDQWVRVTGTVGAITIHSMEEPAIVATAVEPVAQPQNPYLYP